MFKFNINDKVKVPLNHLVLTGEIVLRQYVESSTGKRTTYQITYAMGRGCGTGGMEVGEDKLVEYQLLESSDE